MIYKSQLFLIAVLISGSAYAQDVSGTRIQWTASNVFDLVKGERTTKQQAIITGPSSRISWLDENDSILKTFEVQSVAGTWADIKLPGAILYHIKEQDVTGTVEITKSATNTVVKITLYYIAGLAVYELTVGDSEVLYNN